LLPEKQASPGSAITGSLGPHQGHEYGSRILMPKSNDLSNFSHAKSRLERH